jgi:hypothetical protein
MKTVPHVSHLVEPIQAEKQLDRSSSRDQPGVRSLEEDDFDWTGLILPPLGLSVLRQVNRAKKFDLGRLFVSPKAAKLISPDEIIYAVARHTAADWGVLNADEWERNDVALRTGARLVSCYQAANGLRFWLITDANRSITKVRLPAER